MGRLCAIVGILFSATPAAAADVDLDGLPDEWELAWFGTLDQGPGGDPDGDGLVNADEHQWGTDPTVADTDGDGLSDGRELGTDGDADPTTVTNPLSPDTDGDGLWDGEEDANRNGRVDPGETSPAAVDTDGDSIADGMEGPSVPAPDTDGDGVPDPLDLDSDGDGVPDATEAGDTALWTEPVDSDLDGIPDFLDTDTDNDGIPDGVEHAGDADGDGLPDPDADGDGLPNRIDLDADGDGKPDAIEGTDDVDGDGIPNWLDADDADGPGDDGTGPGGPDPASLPSDYWPGPGGDGRGPGPDRVRPDVTAAWMGTAGAHAPLRLVPQDPADSDGDGLLDTEEAVIGTDPYDPDTDHDTIPDGVEVGDPAGPRDTDSDGTIDALDADSDGDQLPDRTEAGGDGRTPVDTDGDGVPDYRDLDSDDDGLGDTDEVQVYGTSPILSDTDGGSVTDGVEVARGTDPLDAGDDVPLPAPLDPWAGASAQGGLVCGATARPAQPAGALALAALVLGALGWRRRGWRGRTAARRAGWAAATVAVLAAMPAARAQVDGQTWFLSAPGTGVLGGATARTLGFLGYSVGMSSEYARDALVVARDGVVLRHLLEDRVILTTHGAFGVWRWLDVGFDVPAVVHMSGTGLNGRRLGGHGLGDIRLWVKGLALSQARFGLDLGLVASLGAPTGEPERLTGAGEVTGGVTVVLGGHVGRWTLLGGLGYRALPERRVLDLRRDDALDLSFATRWTADAVAVSLRVLGSGSLAAPFSRLEESNLEALASVTWMPIRGLELEAGLGAGLLPGGGTPSVRAFASVGWVVPAPEAPRVPVVADADGDGIPDATDRCPTEAEDRDGFQDDDGCPDPDDDGDGIPDTRDKCPREPEDRDGFQDEDGCPDPDNDGDGIPDTRDKCPLAPETVNGVDDDDGCPDEKLVVLDPEAGRIRILKEAVLHFDWMEAEVPPEALAVLKQVAYVLKVHPEIERLRVEGHTSWTGPADFNLALSRRRAAAVVAHLVRLGVAPKRLEVRGYGFSRLKVRRAGKPYNRLNRRVEFVIVPEPGPHPAPVPRSP